MIRYKRLKKCLKPLAEGVGALVKGGVPVNKTEYRQLIKKLNELKKVWDGRSNPNNDTYCERVITICIEDMFRQVEHIKIE